MLAADVTVVVFVLVMLLVVLIFCKYLSFKSLPPPVELFVVLIVAIALVAFIALEVESSQKF